MKPNAIKLYPPLMLAGLSFFGDPFHSHAGWTETNEIGRLWQRLLNIEHQKYRDVMYEVHIQNVETEVTGEFEIFVGYEVNEIADISYELCLKSLPETTYAIFTLTGEQMQADISLVSDWLQQNPNWESKPFFVQRYDHRFKGLANLTESELDFLIPITWNESRADEPD